jgi:hypothetical protein
MSDISWDRITDAIDVKFGISSHGHDEQPLEDAPELTEKLRWVCFEREGQDYKLERVTGPAIIDRRTVGARRAGAVTHVENVYDTDETASRVSLYRKTGGEWVPINADELGI